MSKLDFMRRGVPRDFSAPTALPETDAQAAEWQAKNCNWWQSHPMRYDFGDAPIPHEEGTPEFYAEVDRRFFVTVRQAFPWKSIPFDNFIDFAGLADQSVLEIGVGCGTHAGLLSRYAGRFVGVDLTEYATRATRQRLRMAGASGAILRLDAEHLALADESFDFVWSWGVLHHSSNTPRIIDEVHRVLRPGGRFVLMVYHRSFWNIYVRGGLYYGVVRGGFLRGSSVHQLVQESTDGAFARHYTIDEWRRLVADRFEVQRVQVFGNKSQLVPLPHGRLKRVVERVVPDGLARWITNRPFMGYLLVCSMSRKA